MQFFQMSYVSTTKNSYIILKIILKQKQYSAAAINNGVVRRRMHFGQRTSNIQNVQEKMQNNFIQFHGDWPAKEQEGFIKDMRIIPDFITEEEEGKLCEEIEPYLKRMRYEFDHWDDAIHGFRETERKHWYPYNRAVLDRVKNLAFDGEIMPFIHVLDLAEKGVIKPHVDSTRYCGTTIAGISLLSDCVMRLVRTDEKKYKQPTVEEESKANTDNDSADNYRNQPVTTLENNFYADLLLTRRSLYIMCHSARYNFTHEVLSNDKSLFQGQSVTKSRRISIICRNEP